MMKSYVLVATLLMGTSSLMSMLPDMKECKKLKFVLDGNHCIKSHSIKTICGAPVNSVVGHRLIDVLPFNDPTIIAFGRASSQAEEKMKTMHTILTFDNKK